MKLLFKREIEWKSIQSNASLNLKRTFHCNKDWKKAENENPYLITDLQEIKTTWHPIENIVAKGGKY